MTKELTELLAETKRLAVVLAGNAAHEEQRVVYEELVAGMWFPRETFEVRSDAWIHHKIKHLISRGYRNVRAQKRTVTTITGPWEEVKS